MEDYRENMDQNEENLKKLEEDNLNMVAGGAKCSGHAWQKVEGNLYFCPKCGTYQTFNLGK